MERRFLLLFAACLQNPACRCRHLRSTWRTSLGWVHGSLRRWAPRYSPWRARAGRRELRRLGTSRSDSSRTCRIQLFTSLAWQHEMQETKAVAVPEHDRCFDDASGRVLCNQVQRVLDQHAGGRAVISVGDAVSAVAACSGASGLAHAVAAEKLAARWGIAGAVDVERHVDLQR